MAESVVARQSGIWTYLKPSLGQLLRGLSGFWPLHETPMLFDVCPTVSLQLRPWQPSLVACQASAGLPLIYLADPELGSLRYNVRARYLSQDDSGG